MKQEKKNTRIPNILFCILMILFSCSQKSDDETKKQYYPSGKIKVSAQMSGNEKNGQVIHFYENGVIEQLENYVHDTINGETFSFYSSGFLEHTSILKMGLPNGVSYGYYNNGKMKEYRQWVDGLKQGYGEDYWEKDGSIKAIYYARNDTVIYRRLFDTLGYVIKMEGDVPAEPNAKVN